jgi:hypothetical protein
MTARYRLTIVGSGTVSTADLPSLSRNAASFYADPAAWLVTHAVQRALDDCAEDVLGEPDEVAVIVVSSQGTEATMTGIARSARAGRLSPLRFAGASPGLLAGLPCARLGLRGPSLMVTTGGPDGLDTAALLADTWLRAEHARYALVVSHQRQDDRHHAQCLVTRIGRGDEPRGGVTGRLSAPGSPTMAGRGPGA